MAFGEASRSFSAPCRPPFHVEGSYSDELELWHLGVWPGRRAWPRGGQPADRRRVVCRDRCVVCSVSCPVSLERDQAGSGLVVRTLVPGLQKNSIDSGKGPGVL